jgi:hypothetical protein
LVAAKKLRLDCNSKSFLGASYMAGEVLGVQLVFGLFKRLDREFIRNLQMKYSIPELERSLGDSRGKRAVRALLGLPIFFGLCAGLIYAGYKLAVLYSQRDPDMQLFFGFMPQLFGGGMLGFAVALLVGFIVELVSTRIAFGDRMHEYMALECLRHGFDVYRRSFQMIAIFCLPLAFFALLSFDMYTFATSRDVVLNPYWGIGETRYPFSQIQSLEERSFMGERKGRTSRQVYHVITFLDGHEWTSHSDGGNVSPRTRDEGRALVEYLSQQTGVPITKAPIDP